MATRRQLEFGDFQTPPQLAAEVCQRMRQFRWRPRAIIEPTCGTGVFLEHALKAFPAASAVRGYEISRKHLQAARYRLASQIDSRRCELRQGDFFDIDWSDQLARLPEPLLVIGNPPWINSARMTNVGGDNRPPRSNSDRLSGLDAMTGKSNFDISEWMLRRLVESLDGRHAALAMLCKTSTARKVLLRLWKKGRRPNADLFRIDARRYFQAAVDACLLVCRFGRRPQEASCREYDTVEAGTPSSMIGFQEGRLIADLDAYHRCRHIVGQKTARWRSGIKHDCAQVLELRRDQGVFRNGLGEVADVERTCLYPLLKGAQLSRGSADPARWLLVTQRAVNEDTRRLEDAARKTWHYLNLHGDRLDRRKSVIYRGRCRFAMFGVGPYAFAPWKVAISGLHKKLAFVKVGRHQRKPLVLDDTCYFLPCLDEAEVERRRTQLSHPLVEDFFSAFLFRDAKRPITAQLLNSLDLDKLSLNR
jgi:hypothetical protein